MSGAGDVNGDGFDDLIVGAPLDASNGTDSGSARVFSGADGSIQYNFVGDSDNDKFGNSVSGAGDVNGDGFVDLIVGAPLDESNGTSSGSARILSGSDGSVLYNFVGDSAGDLFGLSVSGAGDANGDGFDDLIVGASSATARLYSGSDGGVLYDFDSGLSSVSVSEAGDVNKDSDINFLDINPFIAILVSNTFLEQADCNQDDAVNFLDIAPFIAILADQ